MTGNVGLPAASRRAIDRLRLIARRSCSLITWLMVGLVTAACDETFTPLAPAQIGFSVFGYLDASADTQWIRVMPIRSSITTTSDSFAATVTLEDLGTGRIIELRDSIFRFTNYNHPDIGSDGVYVHTFWTTEKIEPGSVYRFTARRAGEAPAEAVVAIPSDYNFEVWISQFVPSRDMLRIEGLKHVAFVRKFAHFRDFCGSDVHSLSLNARLEGAAYMVPIRRDTTPPRGLCGLPRVEKSELWTAGSQAAWPAGGEFSTSGIGVADDVSNIANSTGFIGGLLTKSVPYEECTFQGFAPGGEPVPQYCRLRYDSSTAWLKGTVTETRCGDGGIDSATVTLRELDREPASHRRIRKVAATRTGQFEMGALEVGMRYALEVRGKPDREPTGALVNIHSIHTDTVQFTAAERRQYDVGLIRYTLCSQKP